jgi:hypothetical protein
MDDVRLLSVRRVYAAENSSPMTRMPPSCASSKSPEGTGKASNLAAPGHAKSSWSANGSGRAAPLVLVGKAYVEGGERTSMAGQKSLNS